MTMGHEDMEPPAVYALGPGATVDDLESDHWYLGEINGVVPYGVFVDLNDRISGLVHESNLPRKGDVGDELVVTLESIQPNGDVSFEAIDVVEYEIEPLEPSPDPVATDQLEAGMEGIMVEGRVDQINQTAGPTVFSVCDGTGVVPCAAFEAAGIRAYPDVDVDDIVRLLGSTTHHNGGLQLEVEALTRLSDEQAVSVRTQITDRLEEHATPETIDPLIDWDILAKMGPSLESLATELRLAILESRPVQIRHHADGDGMCAAVPVRMALERFATRVHHDSDAPNHLVSRAPSKAPYYEMEDATRDLTHALRNQERHGQRLPLLLMLDNGSTAEDVPAYRNLAHYDIPIAVIDHHHPDPDETADLLTHHLNPYLVGEDYRVTTGMLCVELARMIDPELTSSIEHIPAVAGLADRSSAQAMQDYLALARNAGYDRQALVDIGDALDYAAHWLQYQPGDDVVRDILGISEPDTPHDAVVNHFATEARAAIDQQVEAASPHVKTSTLPNGATLNQLDVDAHAHRFRYPAPGKTTGAIHDAAVGESGDPTITLGYGPDFCVMRSDGVRLDIPSIVDDLQETLPGAGVSGGGHLVVGSIKFVSGQRDAVLEALIERIGNAPIDETLTSAKAGLDEIQ